jgi:hypothetical protein
MLLVDGFKLNTGRADGGRLNILSPRERHESVTGWYETSTAREEGRSRCVHPAAPFAIRHRFNYVGPEGRDSSTVPPPAATLKNPKNHGGTHASHSKMV